MDSLPEALQDKLNPNLHELKFVDTLNAVKQLFDDDIELTPAEETSTSTPTDISLSDVENEFIETSFERFIHDNDIEIDRDVFEYSQCVEAAPLMNNISTIQQTQVVTNNIKILIDVTNDCRYCFDELFSGIKSFCRPSIWKKVETELSNYK